MRLFPLGFWGKVPQLERVEEIHLYALEAQSSGDSQGPEVGTLIDNRDGSFRLPFLFHSNRMKVVH